MAASPHPERVIRFEAFELDPVAGELRKSGIRLKLAEQPLRILVRLLDRPGEIVTREELRELLWGNDTFVDFEHGLNAAANRLREVSGCASQSAMGQPIRFSALEVSTGISRPLIAHPHRGIQCRGVVSGSAVVRVSHPVRQQRTALDRTRPRWAGR